MNSNNLNIRQFLTSDSDAVNKLIRNIQKNEFNFTVENFPQPELLDIENFYIASGGNFWVVFSNEILVGTASLLDLGNGIAKLGKMFVHKTYRGKPLRIAQKLLNTVQDWAKQKEFNCICFETITETCAAHYFYERNEFMEVAPSDFPEEYKICPYPSRYFIKNF